MSVVNVKVEHIRPKYQNLRDWTKDENNVYVGRSGVVFIDGYRFPTYSSFWANPFKIGNDGDRDEVLEKYRKHLRDLLKTAYYREEFKLLIGKNLGCWCHPLKCHADIILEELTNLGKDKKKPIFSIEED